MSSTFLLFLVFTLVPAGILEILKDSDSELEQRLLDVEEKEEEEFEGAGHWEPEIRELCDNPELDVTWTRADALCFHKGSYFDRLRIEVLSWQPGLFVYRDLLTKSQVFNYLELLEELEFGKEEVVAEDGTTEVSDYRVANGTVTPDTDFEIAEDIVKSVRRRIPNVNFDSSELLTALKYGPGGHYAAHYDYLDDEFVSGNDSMKDYGNRWATLIMAFKTAEEGGGTVFPELQAVVRPNPGDGIFWFNMMGDLTQEDLSLHGGCPIYSGQKVISTLWIRSRFQPILEIASQGSIPAGLMFD